MKRLKMNKTILFVVVVLSMLICLCFVPFNAYASNTNSIELNLNDTNNSTSTQNDLTSIFMFTPISDTECDEYKKTKEEMKWLGFTSC